MAHFFTGRFKNIKPLAFISLQLIYNFIKFQAADPDCAWYCTFKISTGFWGLISYILVRPDISIVILLTVTDILSKPYEVFSTANATKIEYVNFKRVEIARHSPFDAFIIKQPLLYCYSFRGYKLLNGNVAQVLLHLLLTNLHFTQILPLNSKFYELWVPFLCSPFRSCMYFILNITSTLALVILLCVSE